MNSECLAWALQVPRQLPQVPQVPRLPPQTPQVPLQPSQVPQVPLQPPQAPGAGGRGGSHDVADGTPGQP